MRYSLFFLVVIITLSSCDRSIHGNIKDNFGVPVENISITIPNSGFKTMTDKKGSFKLDYVAGEFDVVFEKEGYLSFNKSLKIAEHKKYPLGDMEMIRLPKEQGIYYIDKDAYVELPRVKLPFTKKEGYEFIVGYYTIKKYYFPKDTFGLLIDADTSRTLKFFDYKAKSAYLTKADDDRCMLEHAKGMSFSGGGSSHGIFIDTEHERVATGIRIIDFKPIDINRSYSFVEISENDFGEDFMSGYGYCFTLKPDTLQ